MENVELFAGELDRVAEHKVSLALGVTTQNRGHNEKVAARGEEIVKVHDKVDVSGEAVAQYFRVFAMQDHDAVEHVDEEMQVAEHRSALH